MTNALCIDEKYSTTKLVTKEKPSIENGVEDKFETVLFYQKVKIEKVKVDYEPKDILKNLITINL